MSTPSNEIPGNSFEPMIGRQLIPLFKADEPYLVVKLSEGAGATFQIITSSAEEASAIKTAEAEALRNPDTKYMVYSSIYRVINKSQVTYLPDRARIKP